MFKFLFASIKKELWLLQRNLHALLVLFVMPLVFILIMSLALQERIHGKQALSLVGEFIQQENSVLGEQFSQHLRKNTFLQLKPLSYGALERPLLEGALFRVYLTERFDLVVEEGYNKLPAIELSFSPRLAMRERTLVKAAVEEAFAHVNVNVLASEMGFDEDYVQSQMIKKGAVQVASAASSNAIISSTQQNVPAWLVFAMFFVSLPISTVVIYEQQQKTLLRLRSMGMSSSEWLFAKLFPYLLINIVQFVFLMLVGRWVLPLFGAEALSLNLTMLGGLVFSALAVSVAALGVAALIACCSRSVEQATILAGTSNIILGALGGIMVPKFVMPEFMQWLTYLSPMGWGQECFIRVLVFGDSIAAIGFELTVLSVFGVMCILIANQVLRGRTE